MRKKPGSKCHRKVRRPRAPSPLARESERALLEQITRMLARPPQERTHFLRVRLPGGGSAL